MKYCLALLLLSGSSIFGSARTIRISDRPSETSGQQPGDAASAALPAAAQGGSIFQSIAASSGSSAGSPAGSGDSSGDSTPVRKRSVVSPTGTPSPAGQTTTPSPVKPPRKLTSPTPVTPIPVSETDQKLGQYMSALQGRTDLSRPFGRPLPGRPVPAQQLPSMAASASAAATGNLSATPMPVPLLALPKAVTDRPTSAASMSRASNYSTDSDEQAATPVYNTPAFAAADAAAMSVPPAPLLTARNSARPNTPATTRMMPQASAQDAKLRAEILALKTQDLALRQLLAEHEGTLAGQDITIEQLMKAREQQQREIGTLRSKYDHLKRVNHGQNEEIIALRTEIARLSAIYCQDQHTPRRIHIAPPPAAGAAAAASAPVRVVAPPDPTPFAALVALVQAGTVQEAQQAPPVAAVSPLLVALPNPNPSNQVMQLRMHANANAAASASAVDDDLFKL